MTACEILGRVPYREALATQFDLRTRRQRGEIADTVLILEHPKVITQGRRPAEQYLLCSPEELQSRGYDWLQVNRGGLLTYHGPGQLVAYFIVSLRERGWTVTEFVHRLEEILILTLEKFNLPAVRRT